MRLLIAADIFPPESGGPATYAVTLANALSAQGESVSIVSLNANSDTRVVSCPVYKVSSITKVFRYLEYTWLLFKHSKNTDIIYAMGPVNAGLPALVVAKLRGKKLVVKVVGDYAWESYQNAGITNPTSDFVSVDAFQTLTMSGKIGRLQKIERFVCQHADTVITPSEYLKKIVVGWGVPNEKVSVIFNAVEFTSVFQDIAKPVAEKWIVSVGRLVPWKGMGTLVEIMPEILKTMPGAKLKIIGSGPEFKKIQTQIIASGLQNVVELLGNIPNQTARAYMHSADVFVLNSGYEGLSNTLLEAMAAGAPVLASNVGGNPELVEAAENLFVFDKKEELIKKILQKITPATKNGVSEWIQSDAFYAKFRTKAMVPKTNELLEKICAN